MKKAELPAYFSTLNKGKITLYIKKEYEHKLSAQDIDTLFNLYKDAPDRPYYSRQNNAHPATPFGRVGQIGRSELSVSYHGRTPCKNLIMKSLNNESFVVRDYWHGGLFGKILRDLFWQTLRPLRELSICEVASKSGINTTEVIAIVKNNIIGPLYKCQLVSKEISNAIDLIELLLHPENSHLLVRKRQIISKLAKAIKDMHDAGIYHADLHLKNILIQSTEGGSINVYIIDLDKSKQYEKIGLHRRMKNIMRLDRSLEKFRRNVSNRKDLHESYQFPLTNADKMRFLREYIKLSYKSEQHSSGGQKEFLKSCLMNYRTTHKLHRLWWHLTEDRRQKF
ncbi:MAG: KDO kinase (2-keto-3-deoxy-D-manno-octulosonic acid) [Candidatus Scalindua rubra]|uniref:KDO kinase (2-keto-3-deoxy-D-manno-octulosonic acid) n=1 Tax=Candidatus Scalindua rubra TaxID=1872076 RepID=A0A1E3XHE4_9BACT|nr:MAG: KDO kinase (2-keto-3-deoxy-D-manno-octulosonic acid) [Candidatus Scalindua rubra]